MQHARRPIVSLFLLVLLSGLIVPAQPAAAAALVVTNTNATGAGSLFQAVTDANANPGADTISFNIAAAPLAGGYWHIQLVATPFLTLTDNNTTINGFSQPGGRTDGGPKIEISGPDNTQIGTSAISIQSSGNVIQGLILNTFGGAGIIMSGAGATNNAIYGNYIGTNWDGTTRISNFFGGIRIIDAASNNTVGGLGAGQRNVISGNGTQTNRAQITLDAGSLTAASQLHTNQIVGNYIGTNASGTAALSSASHGIVLGNNAVDNVIGPGNVISGNGNTNTSAQTVGISIEGSYASGVVGNNTVKGNIIGLNAAGTAAIANGNSTRGGGGVRVAAPGHHVIGGTGAGEGNVISGHAATTMYGVLLNAQCGGAQGTDVQGNLIGLNAAGTAAIANYQGVVFDYDATFNVATLLGPCNNVVGPGNTISGNTSNGVSINGVPDATDDRQTKANTVQGNRIGTNPAGTGAITNGANGILVSGGAIFSTIGGASASLGNTIAGNTNYGVLIKSTGTQNETNTPNNTTLQYNYIGTTADGNGALANATGGVLLQLGAHDNLLANNLISGHTGTTSIGVTIQDSGTDNNRLLGNTIGTNAARSAALSNRAGVSIVGGATNNHIGESGQTANFIANNLTSGVGLNNTSNNQVVNNTLSSNGADGVLVNGGTGNLISGTSTTNNGGNGISLTNNGNNNRQAPTSLGLNSGNLVGTAPGCSGCTIELFMSDVAEAGEGPIYVPLSPAVTTDGAGNFSIALPFAGCKPFFAATATDATKNTSPFSQPFGPVASCLPSAPNIVLTAASPASVSTNPGTTTTYIHQLTNTGTGVGVFTVNLSSSQGWGTLVPPTTSYTLNPGQSVNITVSVVVPGSAAGGTVDVSTITASVTGQPPVSRVDTTTVNQVFSFQFTPNRSGTVLPGNFIDYTHYITNTGNGSDDFTLSETHVGAGVTVSFPDCTLCTVGAGLSRTIHVRVTVAASSLAFFDDATITATSKGGVAHQVIDHTTIQQTPVPAFEPPTRMGAGKPGTTVTYTHLLRNIGGLAGTFSVNATLPANATADGWTVTSAPVGTFNLTPNATQSITVVVSIPAYTPARTTTYSGTQILATVTASAGAGNPTGTANDTTTVLLQPTLDFAPDRSSSGAPSQVIEYAHVITNTGNGQERFNFTATPPAGWSAVVLDGITRQPITSVTIGRGLTRPVIVQVTVAAGVGVGFVGTTIVTATAASDGSVHDNVTDTTTIVSAAVPQLSPGQTGSTDPGVAISFTHTITNVGNADALTTPFSVTVAVPVGWSATIVPASIPLAVGAKTTFVVTVTPPANALVRAYPITIRAAATDANAAVATVVDTVNVNPKARLIFTPNYDDLRDPGTVVTYTHTLTNSGNFTDTIGLSARASQPWAITLTPSQTTLPPGATARVTVTLTIPPGIVAGLKNTTYVTATSSLPPVRAIVTDTATIRAVPGLRLTPPLLFLAGEAGQPVTFTFKLLNTGSVPQIATLTTTPPAGWTATPLPATVPTLQPGQETDVRVVVTAPEGTARNTVGDTLLKATSNVPHPDTGVPPVATATAQLRVGPAYQFIIEPDRAVTARPGQLIRYSHQLTNTGLQTDTIVLSTQSILGWSASVIPSSVTLAPGATVPVTVTVLVPTSAEADTVEVTTVTGRSTSKTDVQDSAIDTTSVLRVAGVNISPPQNTTANPSQVIEFQHRVFNIGNSIDAFTLSYTAPNGWEVTLVQTRTIALLPGFTYPVQVRVKVPANLSASSRASITVRATSVFDPSVYDEVVDTLGAVGTQGGDLPQEFPYRVYLPTVQKAP